MKNPGSLQDDFWSLFLTLWTVGFSFIWNVTRFAYLQPSDLYVNFCTKVNPVNEKNTNNNKNSQVEVLVCLILHIAITARIQIFRFSNTRKPKEFNQPHKFRLLVPITFICRMLKK
jgi:hypothetical protein